MKNLDISTLYCIKKLIEEDYKYISEENKKDIIKILEELNTILEEPTTKGEE